MYGAYYYVNSQTKKIPAREFLLSLPVRDRGRIIATVEFFEEKGKLPGVYRKHIEGPVSEIRVRVARNRYRILYVLTEGKRILLLLGFTKRQQKTPRQEIERALEAYADYRKTRSAIVFQNAKIHEKENTK